MADDEGGTLLNDRYRKGHEIGSGGFGTVYYGTDVRIDRRPVALKQISRRELGRRGITEKRVKQEIEIHKKLKHPNVVQFYDAFFDDYYIYIVIEYCSKGDMRMYLEKNGPLTEADASSVFTQVVRGVKHLHEQEIMHRDLSVANILISEITRDGIKVKIGDLGLATMKAATPQQQTLCGTLNYMAPQVANKLKYDYKADIYSLGAVLYTLLAGRPPFSDQRRPGQPAGTLELLRTGRNKLNLDSATFSPEASDLIERMMKQSADERITLKDALAHVFVRRYLRHEPSGVSADSGRGSYRGSAYSAPETDRYANREIGTRRRSPSADRFGRLPSHERRTPRDLPPLPSGRSVPDRFTRRTDVRQNCVPTRPERSIGRQRSASSSRLMSCAHSRVDNDHCVRCGLPPPCERRVSVCERCRSYEDTGACVGTCGAVCHTSREKSGRWKSQQQQQPPILTKHLNPQTERSKYAMIRILPGGELCAEFIREDSDQIKNIMRITRDGQRIVVSRPKGLLLNPAEASSDDLATLETFTLENLPDEYRKRYRYVSRFVDMLKSKTPKLTCYSDRAKCTLFEDNRFEIRFYNGKVASKKEGSSNKSVTNARGERAEMTVDEDKYMDSQEQHCSSVAHLLEGAEINGNVCFPIIMGRRPSSSVSANNTPRAVSENKENKISTPVLPVSGRKPLSSTNSINGVSLYNGPNNGSEIKRLSDGIEDTFGRNEILRVKEDVVEHIDSRNQLTRYKDRNELPVELFNKVQEMMRKNNRY